MTSSAPPRDFARFNRFLDKIAGEVYPEPPSTEHTEITRIAVKDLLQRGVIKAGDKVLDVGCGQGVALEIFGGLGLSAVGITLGPDAAVCRDKGFDAREMDQNFMEFPDGAFDLLWCRHVLEHSIAPLFTLDEYRRVTKPGGHVYVEVPAPDTVAHHEDNPNHYSVLPISGWLSLFRRTGFVVAQDRKIKVTVPVGADVYWSFLLRVPN